MDRNTVIVEKHHTSDGDVDVTMEINVHGKPDAVAQVDTKLIPHIKSHRMGLDEPYKRETNGQTIPEPAEAQSAYEDALRRD